MRTNSICHIFIGFKRCIKILINRFIAGSARCSTNTLSILLTKLLTHIKQGLQKYCETAYSRSGVNQIWILKNSKELLEHLKSPNFNHITSIKSFDFSTLYTTIPHDKLKSRLASIIRNSFNFKNRRYKYLVLVTKKHTLWGQSDVDPKEFKRIIRTSSISKFQDH